MKESFKLKQVLHDTPLMGSCPFLFPLVFYLVGKNSCLMNVIKF